MDDNFRGTRGSLPPQLFKYIDQDNMAAETARFTEYINSLSGDFLDRVSEIGRRDTASQKKQTTPIVDDATNGDNAVRAAAGDFWQNVHHVQPYICDNCSPGPKTVRSGCKDGIHWSRYGRQRI